MLEYEDVVLGQTYFYVNDYYVFDRKDAGRYRFMSRHEVAERSFIKYSFIDKNDWYSRDPSGEYYFLYTSLKPVQASSIFLRLVIKFVLDRDEH